MSPTELTLEDFDYMSTFDDPFLRAAFAQESFKFRYQRKDPYIRVKWWSIIVNDPFARSVPPRKVSQFLARGAVFRTHRRELHRQGRYTSVGRTVVGGNA